MAKNAEEIKEVAEGFDEELDVVTDAADDAMAAAEHITADAAEAAEAASDTDFYHDEKQESVNVLKTQAEVIAAENREAQHSTFDIVKDILGFFFMTALAFAWLMIMLLIISFVTLSYIHFDIRYMIIASIIFAIAVAIYYIHRMSKKYEWGGGKGKSKK